MKFINRKLQHILKRVTKKDVVIVTVIFLLFTALVLPFISSYTTNIIGVAESPDTSFNFSLIHLYNIVDSYGKDGRIFYVTMRWTFDIVWPIVYTVFLLSSIAYFSKEIKHKHSIKLLYLPLLAVLFDLLENINATIIMLLYPSKIDVFGYFLFASSVLKWITISISFVIVIVLIIGLFIKRFKKQ